MLFLQLLSLWLLDLLNLYQKVVNFIYISIISLYAGVSVSILKHEILLLPEPVEKEPVAILQGY